MSRRFLLSVALVFAIVISTSALLPLPVTPQDGPGSTDDQIPVIISLNTAEFVSSEHSRVTSFDALKAEVVFSLSQKQPHALSIDSKESRGQLKRDSRPINALSANIPLSLRDELLQLNAIEEIYPDIKMHVLVDKSVPLVNTPAVWQLKDSEGDYVTGKGVLVAVLGTGVNYSVLKGIAPDATLLAYKVLEPSESGHASGDTSDIIAGIERAVNDDADIMCMSFGCMFGQGPSPIERAVDAAVSDGVTVVAGAGNGGPSIGSIASPAGYKNVIAVGAVEKERDVATVEVIPENKIL
jgi:subtilisin family serine protease